MDCNLVFLCFIIPSILGYSIKINPHIQTAVNTLQARGSNNSLSFSQISNSTILNAIPAQIQQSHQNELISFSITLVIFTLVFLVLAKIINQQVLTTYKLHLISVRMTRCYLILLLVVCLLLFGYEGLFSNCIHEY